MITNSVPETAKRLSLEKGIAPIIAVIVLAVILVGGGAYYFKQQTKSAPATALNQTVRNHYVNTTLGYSLVLPEGWIACESGETGGRVRVGKNQICGISWDESLLLDTALNDPIAPLERKQGESFLEWVKRYSQKQTDYLKSPDKVESEFTTINPQVIVEKRTYSQPNEQYDKISYTKDIYIEDSQTTAFLLSAVGPYGMTRDRSLDKDIVSKFPLEQFIPLIKSAPITAGDITGGIGIKRKDGGSIYPNYQGTFYQGDKKTVATTFTADKNGTYLVRLKPGTYYFIHPDKKEEKITVILGKDTRFSPDIEE